MKRVISILSLLALLASLFPVAFADDTFTLRDGIEFGDTLDTVESKNKTLKKVTTCKQYNYIRTANINSVDWLEQAFKKYPDNGVWFNGKILGWADMDCGFFFRDDALIGMNYSFPFTKYGSDSAVACYRDIRDSLIKKYGEPLDISDGYTFVLTGPAFERMNRVKYLSAWEVTSEVETIDTKEWYIEKESYNVKIDLVIYTYSRNKSYDIFIDLSYQKFTPEEYEKALQKNRAKANALDDEL